MVPRRDDVEALAGVAALLLEPRDPADLAKRFFEYVAELFPSDAGLLYVPEDEPPRLDAFGLDADEAVRLAADLYADLVEMTGSAAGAFGRVALGTARARWRRTLATIVGIGPGRRGLVALFSGRSDAFDAERDGTLLHHMARHATAALGSARLRALHREEAERFAVQAEEIERVRHALERHSREIESTLASRSRFFALMIHELRTPTNAVLGYADLLHEGALGELTPRQAEAVEKVVTSARRLLALVNDILDLSKIEAGRLAVQSVPLDLGSLTAEAMAEVELEASRKSLELRVDCPADVAAIRSDAARIRQILLNLLANAVKFTEAGSISLVVRHIAPGAADRFDGAPPCPAGIDGWIGIAVEDTGPGIPRAELDAIFGEYNQLGTEPPGTGLGLAISRRLARLLGGELVADSEVGVRSTFILYVPCPTPIGDPASDPTGHAVASGSSDRRPA